MAGASPVPKRTSPSTSLTSRVTPASAASCSDEARENTGISSRTSTFSIGCRPSRSRSAGGGCATSGTTCFHDVPPCVSNSIRNTPCASSVFSESSPSSCSFCSERQMAMPDALTVAVCGTPSKTSSKPSDAGAATSSAGPGWPSTSTGVRATRPSSRNCSSDDRRPAS